MPETTPVTSPFDSAALELLHARYLGKDPEGRVVETPEHMFRRVARHIAAVEERYGGDAGEWAKRFEHAMSALEFLPNSPTLMNAGTPVGQLAACFVLPVDDHLESIFATMRDAALVHRSGGGVGFDFSKLRPAGDPLASTGGVSSGPVSFMHVFDAASEAVRSGGRRRAANMGVMDEVLGPVEAGVVECPECTIGPAAPISLGEPVLRRCLLRWRVQSHIPGRSAGVVAVADRDGAGKISQPVRDRSRGPIRGGHARGDGHKLLDCQSLVPPLPA